MNYYAKDVPAACFLPDGRKITCEFVGVDGRGYLATELGYYISQINTAIQRRIGGWAAIDAATYTEALKKKQSSDSSPVPPKQPAWFRRDPSLARERRRAVVGGNAPRGIEVPVAPRPEPLRVPAAEEMKPRSGRMPTKEGKPL